METILQSTGKRFLILFITVFYCITANAQYCTPSYYNAQCDAPYDLLFFDFSTSGGITNISNNGSGCGNAANSYIYYPSKKHTGIQGTTVNFSYRIGTVNPQGVLMWVDFNGDQDFTDAGEQVYTSSSYIGGTQNGSFTIPLTATPGLTRIRIRGCYNTLAFTACDAQGYGETEDYVFEILPDCSSEFTMEPATTKACENSTVMFLADGTDIDSFNWEADYGNGIWVRLGDDVDHSGTTTDTLKIKNLALSMYGFKYRAIGINNTEDCEIKSNPAILEMIPAGKASVVIAPNPGTMICEQTEVTMYASWTNGGTTPGYQWVINGQDVPGEVSGTFKTKALAEGDVVECRFMSSAICVPAEMSNPVAFQVNTLLEPKVELNVSYEGDKTYTFTAVPTDGGANPVYIWYRNGIMLGGVNGNSLTITDLANRDKIVVKMISDEQCINPDYKIVSSKATSVGVDELKNSLGALALSPNPNTGRFTLSGMLNSNSKAITVHITNAIGQLVATYNYTPENNMANLPVNMDGAANGMYNANISNGNEQMNIRFVLSR